MTDAPEGGTDGGPVGAACVPNIGPRQRRRRLLIGWLGVGGALAGFAVLVAMDAGRAWRLVLAAPVYAAAIGFLQHREKT